MHVPGWIRGAAAVCALGLVGATLGTGTARAADSAPDCSADTMLTLLNFNDFHGRIASSKPDTTAFFGALELERQKAGEANTLMLSNGDNIGGSLFTSASQQDKPTLDILNAAGLDASSVGNHEFDKGWDDLNGRVRDTAKFPYLGANVYTAGTTEPALDSYKVFEKDGIKVGVIGAVTGSLPSLVSPDGIKALSIGDPVEGVNRVAAQLKDGDEANGEADVIVAEYHEGAAGSSTLSQEEAASPAFDSIVNSTSPEVDAVMNAHSHQSYTFDGPTTTGTRPVVQAGSYAEKYAKVTLGVDADKKVTCYNSELVAAPAKATDEMLAQPRVAEVQKLTQAAEAEAEVVGAQVIGKAEAPISRALSGDSDDRAVESTMSNYVAAMFFDQLSGDDPEFIGVQNPGGTRADLDAGDITYKEAASVLPFANSLMTAELTGAQVKTMLEQQWQRDADGKVPSRPYLQLGLSKNVSYTFDEARPEGDRVTQIVVNGRQIDPAKKYKVGSGSFLIAGGDNFHVFNDATAKADTGRVDLEAFTDWVRRITPLTPSFAKQAVSIHEKPTELEVGKPTTIEKVSNLDFTTAAPANTKLTAQVFPRSDDPRPRAAGDEVGSATVTGGTATNLQVTLPADTPAGPATLELVGPDTRTVVDLPITVKAAGAPGDPDNPGAPGNPGDPDGPGGSDKPSKLPSTGV